MKTLSKKLMSLFLGLTMVFSISATAFAAEPMQTIITDDSRSFTVLSSTETNYGTMYFVKEDDKPQPRSLWDFADIAMAGASWYDLIKDPSLKNLSWAVLDTAAIAPLIPSSRWIRQGSKYLIPIKEIKKLASTSSGKSKLLKAMKVTKPISKLDEVAKLAKNYKLTNSQFTNHILKNHAYNSLKKDKSKFIQGFDIKKAIKETLTNDSIIKNNTRGREGYIFEKTYSKTIGIANNGKTPLKTIRVILDKNGYVVTAFPVK